jgi:hypothetical protein
MANEFEQLLQAQANNPNFLNGIVTAGAAKLMSDRTQATSLTLDKLNQSLKLLNDEPMTKDQQVEQLKGDASAQEQIQSIEDQAQQYQSLTQNIIDRKGKFNAIYDQALTQLAQIGGEDAQRLAQQLESNRANKLTQLDEQGQVPERVLKYQAMKTELEWNEDKYAEWYNDTELRRDIAEASDFIMQDIEFGDIQGGDVRTWSEDKLNKFTDQQDRIINRAYEKLGGNISKGAISAAFKVAMDNSGKSFTFQELNPLQKMQMDQYAKQEKQNVNLYKGILTSWSSLYNSLDPNTRDALSVYMKEGKVPADMVDAQGKEFDTEYLKELAGIYKPDGEYGYYYSKLTGALGEDFYKTSPYKLKSGETIKDVPADRTLMGIIKPTGFAGFMNQEALYNPGQYRELLAEQMELISGLKSQSFRTKDTMGNEVTDDFGYNVFKDFSVKYGNAFQLPESSSNQYMNFSIFGGRK